MTSVTNQSFKISVTKSKFTYTNNRIKIQDMSCKTRFQGIYYRVKVSRQRVQTQSFGNEFKSSKHPSPN